MQSAQNDQIKNSSTKLSGSRLRKVTAATVLSVLGCFPNPSAVLAANGFDEVPPSEQLEQSCDLTAMKKLDADKVIAYTFADPVYSSQRIDAPGAVFRKNEEWFRLEYHCQTEADHRTVISFEWKVGDKVPRSQWDKYYLYP